jgi:hypothetical protein
VRVNVPEVCSALHVTESGMRMESTVHQPVTTSDALVEDVVSQERNATPSSARRNAGAGNLASGRKGKAHLVAVERRRGIENKK